MLLQHFNLATWENVSNPKVAPFTKNCFLGLLQLLTQPLFASIINLSSSSFWIIKLCVSNSEVFGLQGVPQLLVHQEGLPLKQGALCLYNSS
jgi:hypothetical protein